MQAWYRFRLKMSAFGKWCGQQVKSLHRRFLSTAAPFGVLKTDWRKRWFRFVLMYAIIFSVAIFAHDYLAMLAILYGLWSVVAISRAWADNENQRRQIAKKILDTKPDNLPDLRAVALVSSLATLVILPLLASRMHHAFALYEARPDINFSNWLWFLADQTYLKSIPDFSEVIHIHDTGIALGHPIGRIVVVLARFYIYYIILQSIYRLFDIHHDISDALKALSKDPDLAVRIGQRALYRLVRTFQDQSLSLRERGAAALAMGRIGHPVAFETLSEVADASDTPDDLRAEVVTALGELQTPEVVEVLQRALSRDSVLVQQAAIIALGKLKIDDHRHEHADPVRILLEKLQSIRDVPQANYDVLKRLVESLGQQLNNIPEHPLSPECFKLITRNPSLTTHVSLRLQNRTATTLQRLGHLAGVPLLIEMIDRNSNPKLLCATIDALGFLAAKLPVDDAQRSASRDILIRGLTESNNDSVRAAVARGLANLRDEAALPALFFSLNEALKNDQSGLRDDLLGAISQFGEQQKKDAEQAIREYRQQQSRQNVARLANVELKLEERIKAANTFNEKSGKLAWNTLKRLYLDDTTPIELRDAVQKALKQMNARDFEQVQQERLRRAEKHG
jgi:HEAT repeat protein